MQIGIQMNNMNNFKGFTKPQCTDNYYKEKQK